MPNNQTKEADKKAPPEKGTAQAPAIQLPKGGGAIRGIGEKFAANPVTGTGSMTVPIATSPGRSGFGPQLSLSYDSGAGNGPFGFGWSLSIPSITRKSDKGLPKYQDADESDVFILSGAEDLVPEFEKDAAGNWVIKNGKHVIHEKSRVVNGVTYKIKRYRPRIEGLFARIERWTNQANPADTFWRSISKDNITTWYGKTAESRIADPADTLRVFNWLICQSYDDKGNVIVYRYKEENSHHVDLAQANERNRTDDINEKDKSNRTANRYLKRILYGNRVPYLPTLTPTGWPQPPDSTAGTNPPNYFFEVVFDYEDGHYTEDNPDTEGRIFARPVYSPPQNAKWSARVDPFSTYRAGFEVRTYRLCQRVLMFHHFPDELGTPNYLVRSTDFTYSYENNPGDSRNPVYSFLDSASQSGYVRQANDTYLKRSLPPLEFKYTKPEVQAEVREVDPKSLENLPYGLDGAKYQWIDLDGEGISGILTEQAEGWFYKRNLSPVNLVRDNGNEHTEANFAPIELVARKPSLAAVGSGQQQFLDLAGDGQLDLVALSGPTPGFYERTQDENWESFRPFVSLPNLEWGNQNLKFVDLTGDGHADVLITEDEAFTWYRSRAEEGFGPAEKVRQALDEEKGPRLVFADGTQSIYLSDISGDGLSDLVRIRNGEVCYWPNLGYGRFGAKVTMDRSPWFDSPDQFDPRRIQLADIDGTGTTDIIYIGQAGVDLFFNQSGNSWSNPHRLGVFPQTDNLSLVTAMDLLGNGTACLVWSSPLPGNARRPMRYLDLMGGQKPHLLIKSVNNLGAETHVCYAPSTRFYVQDKLAGKPWITRIPFPVHVVERVETYDHISRNRFVTRYAYHHGYFDGEEREFRGFGMIEQWDTEEFAALTAGDSLAPLVGEGWGEGAATNIDAASHVPPVLTKTWFHTGVYIDRNHISNYFAGLLDVNDRGEYYREPGMTDAQARQLLLDDTVLPGALTDEEEREACRALKGSMLRQEIYALDGTDKEPHPYSVTEQNFTIRRVQPEGTNRYAVFFAHPRESIGYHYERVPGDPRIAHSFTLEVDEFGNVLKSAAVGYDRRQVDLTLDPRDQAKQGEIHITYGESSVTNPVGTADDYRTPLPGESCSYELTGLVLPAGANRFTLAEMLTAGTGAASINYEQGTTPGVLQKRLIEHVRTRYRRDNLTDLLPLGSLESLALPGESYKLAFTPGLLNQVYQRNGQPLIPDHAGVLKVDVAAGLFADRGGYVDLDGNDHWWIPSGRMFYSLNTHDNAATELAYARQHFFLPHRSRDPFHTNVVSTETFVTYDIYDLLVQETRDALGNVVTVATLDDTGNTAIRIDYRVLQPYWVTDPNGNRTRVSFDALGMVAGTAVMGKPPPAQVVGDLLDGFEPDLTQAQIDAFLAKPREPGVDPSESVATQIVHDLLGQASTRIVYDLDRFKRLSKPPFAATIAREKHVRDLAAGERSKLQVSLSYSDGFGREIQKKIQAEPGPLVEGGPSISPRWVSSGWTIFNNKGKPVRQYEPFFDDTHDFKFANQVGVSPILFYDPVERVVATLHPNHTYEKVVFDPWRQESWDVNDTALIADPGIDPDVGGFFSRLPGVEYQPTWYALRTDAANAAAFAARYPDPTDRTNETRAAEKTTIHAGTPSIAHADSLSRTFLTIAHNRFKRNDTMLEEKYATRVVFDIEGNQREVIDAKDRIVMRYDYDMLGTQIHQISMEAGERWMLNDVAGQPIYAWDSRDHRFHTTYDALRRPTESFLSEGTAPERLVGRTVYGESRPNPEAKNQRGKVVQLFDQAGVVTTEEYDFKGNLLTSQRQLTDLVDPQGTRTPAYKTTVDWNRTVQLGIETYISRTRYDALNRPTQLIAPHSDQPGTKVNVIQPIYNEANLLEQVHAWLNSNAEPTGWLDPATASLHAVTDIDYDAKGQRMLIHYGNGARTTYTYDPLTFRLTHLLTRRNPAAFASDCPEPPLAGWPGCQVQNLHYTYDPAGNITHIRDDAQQTIYFRNKRVDPSTEYTYDAVYRLIESIGREHLGQVGGSPIPHSYNDVPRVGLLHPGDGNTMGTYMERYVYDVVGNFLSMQHSGTDPANPGWTRAYTYNEPSLIEPGKKNNRLTSTTVGNTNPATETYPYDAHGNMLSMAHLPKMEWDFKDELRTVDLGGGGTAYYVYDASGQRVRKVVEKNNGTLIEERIYLGGFEVYRERQNGVVVLERETLHVMDDKQRIALVETRTHGDDSSPLQLIRYQFGNHLVSASLELDHQGQIISYEEYYPYGSTSYQAVRSQTETAKRYRYTGKERDEESGLYYHGARSYAPWLGRWTAADPAGIVDGPDLYRYSRNCPVVLRDPGGKQPPDPRQYATREEFLAAAPSPYVPEYLNQIWDQAHPPSAPPPDTTGGASSGIRAIAGSLQASDIALRDLYKLTNAERAAVIRGVTELLKTAPQAADKAGTMAWSASGLRNLLRAATQEKLTPVGKLLSRLLEKDRSWAQIVKKYGDPFNAALTSEQRMAIAEKITAATARSSRAMNALQVFGKGLAGLNMAISGFQIHGGINKIRSGKVGEGVIDIAEGTTSASLTVGTYAGVKSGAIVVAEGTGLAIFGTGTVAAGSLSLAFEEIRRAMRGDKSLAEGAVDYWKNVQQDELAKAQTEGRSVGGALKFVGNRFGQVGAGVIHYPRKGIVRTLEWLFD